MFDDFRWRESLRRNQSRRCKRGNRADLRAAKSAHETRITERITHGLPDSGQITDTVIKLGPLPDAQRAETGSICLAKLTEAAT